MSKKSIRSRFLSIIDKYLKGKSNPEQNTLVDYFYDSIPNETISEEKLAVIGADIKNNIDQNISNNVVKLEPRRYTFLKIASCFVLLGIASTYVVQKYFIAKESNYALARNEKNSPIIVLRDGESYDLQDTMFNKLTQRVLDKGEKVFLLPADFGSDRTSINQIKNPSDRIFAFQLHDGTKAWLNPHSTLEILPITDGKRLVKIAGTVLFDVQKVKTTDSYMPFVVKTALQTIEVLGTKFIVNSFDKVNEDVLLLEGKVKLTHNNFQTAVILKPDQKASLRSTDPKILITKATDGYKVEAWHKGLFYFENEKMEDVMAEIAQWYGEEIVVSKNIRHIPITGMISRYDSVDQALKMIELTNNVKYTRSGSKIYVK
ncbi:FecR family protein [Pedobacter helvus]|uniref:FecR family protein n=1 Tax=Pedobacter helvus TaxID=2563444 RepID=A0ABW9JQ39_9SPHI|nr:FecR family protein [Pedobacter ureilyticus]